MSSRLLLISAFVGWAASAQPATAAQRPALFPDPSQAEIDGQVAMGLWPVEDGKIVGPEGFTVHLADDNVLEKEYVYPAGTWFQPPPGRYKVWTEGSGDASELRISPFFTLLSYAPRPFRGRGLAARGQVTAAGRVQLDSGHPLSENQSLRLIHLDPPLNAGARTRGFMRAVVADRADQPVLMPVGRILGLVYDTKKKKYLAASHPVTVSSHGIARVKPIARQGVSDLLVVLHRDSTAESTADDDPQLFVRSADGSKRHPDVLIPTWEWIYAVWYDVPGRSVEIEAETPRSYLAPTEVVLEPGSVATLRSELQPRPSLKVRLDLPPELEPRRAVLELERRDDRQRVARRELPLDSKTVTSIEGLPAADLAAWLVLETDPIWKTWRRVDLRDGRSQELVLKPEPILLTGTIYYGDEPTAAKLKVQTLNEQGMDLSKATLDAEVDGDGSYRAVLFSPGKYLMSVEIPGGGPPFQERYAPYVAEDTVFDIHVPRSGLRVHVLDAVTREPIAGARAAVYNEFVMEFRDPPMRGGGSHGGISDEEGWVDLPPLFPGNLELQVRKDGYLASDRLESVIEPGRVTEITVDLEPVGDTQTLRLRLPNGQPAAGAEVRAQATTWNDPPIWQGRADESGVVHLPRRGDGSWLLIRHAEAGSWVQRWSAAADSSAIWTLSRIAAPVTFKAVGLDGEIVPYASLALRFPETWVAGSSLAWLAGAPVAGASADGLWTANRLPAERLLVVAGTPETISLARQDSLYGMALPISPPWPSGAIEVPADRRP